MKSTVYTVLRLVAGVFTVFALIVQHYIPPKIVSLRPNPDLVSTLYGQPRDDGGLSAQWIDEERQIFSCEFAPQDPYSCGYALRLAEDEKTGLDISSYDGINIHLHYKGDAPEIRLSARHYDERHHNPESPGQSSKFMSVLIRTKDLNEPAYVRLSELGVAEWWVREFDASRENSAPEFTNIISLGIDFISRSNNLVAVEKIELVGDRIQKETFYLTIIAIWMVLILLEGFTKVYAIYKESRNASQQIDRLLKEYKKLEVQKREFESLSITDALTGIMNRAGIQQFLKKLFEGNFDRGRMGLLIIDIDHFKRINDRRGHDAGDRVLRGVAKLIEQNVRQTDVLGRWGGEEFVLICPQSTQENLAALAEKLRHAVYSCEFESDKEPLRVSISIGVAVAQSKEAFDDLFKRADEALYEAKNGGRNCVVFKAA